MELPATWTTLARRIPLSWTIRGVLLLFLALRGTIEYFGYELVRRWASDTPSAKEILARESTLGLWLLIVVPLIIRWARQRPLRMSPIGTQVLWHGGRVLAVTSVFYVVHYGLGWATGWDGYPSNLAAVGRTYAWIVTRHFFYNLVWYFVVAFWTNYQDSTLELRHRDVEAERMRADLSQARLAALTARLQPHFLYNSLHTISSLVIEHPEESRRMLSRLGDLLRATVAQADDEIPLSRELEILDCYLEIERVRFGSRLEAIHEIGDGLRDALVPPLLLQPLAENAVRHGLAAASGKARVSIRASVEAGRLVLAVMDSGAGVPGAPADRGGPGGLGLSTTRARLENLYPGDHSLDLRFSPGRGTMVRIELPLRRAAAPTAMTPFERDSIEGERR